MARISERDVRAVRDLSAMLGVLEQNRQPALAQLVVELRALLGAERVLAYGVGFGPDGYALDFAFASGFALPPEKLDVLLHVGLSRMRGQPWALYDPRAPDPSQRNVAVVMPPPRSMAARRGDALFNRLHVSGTERRDLADRMVRLNEVFLGRIGIADMDVCRALVCDGDKLLAWIGACQSGPFSERDRAILARLLPAIGQRLRTERVLGDAQLYAAALPVVLEAIAQAAFLLDARGNVKHANATARVMAASEGRALAERLREVVHDAAPQDDFLRSEIASAGLPKHFLLVRRPAQQDCGSRLREARQKWQLTPRETDVLARLVWGEANKSIASALGCVERTVEIHVTQLLAKAGVDGRAALVAQFWTG